MRKKKWIIILIMISTIYLKPNPLIPFKITFKLNHWSALNLLEAVSNVSILHLKSKKFPKRDQVY